MIAGIKATHELGSGKTLRCKSSLVYSCSEHDFAAFSVRVVQTALISLTPARIGDVAAHKVNMACFKLMVMAMMLINTLQAFYEDRL